MIRRRDGNAAKDTIRSVGSKIFARRTPRVNGRCILPSGGVVLDPFAGSGTTLAVATRLGRHAIGIELYEQYVRTIHERCRQSHWVFDV